MRTMGGAGEEERGLKCGSGPINERDGQNVSLKIFVDRSNYFFYILQIE